MKKTLLTLLSTLVFATTASLQAAPATPVTISDFSEAISSDAPWVWNSGNKTITISGPNSSAGLIYPDSEISMDISSAGTKFKLTMSSLVSVTNPGGGFFVSLESTGGGLATGTFNWSAFTTSVVNETTFSTSGGFNPATVVNWNIGDGGNGGSGTLTGGASLVSLQVVPEPSTYALMALGGLVLFFAIRRRSAQA
jgi:hypothetical protein